MLELNVIFFTLLSTLSINYFLLNKKLLLDKKYSSHKSFVSNSEVPLSGGIIFLLSISVFYTSEFYQLKIALFAIFLVGFFSDINFISSPIKRILIQIFIILFFLYIDQTYIYSIRWEFLDYYLKNTHFGYFFSLFCLIILINGTNFMDGVNTLATGYFLIITFIILYLANNFNLELNFNLAKIILATLLVILIFNFFGKLFLGDSGSYLISFIIGYMLINFSNENQTISPYFVACMLWYPAYENLFSIIRKKINKNSPAKADNKHLHQLFYIFIQNRLSYSPKTLNTLTGLIIIFFNSLVLMCGAIYFDDTRKLIILIVLSVLFYNFFYYYFLKKTLLR